MLFTAVPPIMAPQTTGHPAALPQDVARRNPDERVSAAKPGSATDTTRGDPQRWHENPRLQADGRKKASAPPTILQIKINTMLEEQQEKQAQEKREAPRPERTDPSQDSRAAPLPPDAAATPATTPEGPEGAETRQTAAKPAVVTPLYGLATLAEAPAEHALSRSA
ncbi:MAG: hypothetical protein EP318_10080 [Rhodobacteraceae bacterium]|nr:MAG: hypothetical protein EP318_10080 [Paracoccaceae bacterium]